MKEAVVDRVEASLGAYAARDAAWDQIAAQTEADAEQDPSLVLPIDGVATRLSGQLQ